MKTNGEVCSLIFLIYAQEEYNQPKFTSLLSTSASELPFSSSSSTMRASLTGLAKSKKRLSSPLRASVYVHHRHDAPSPFVTARQCTNVQSAVTDLVENISDAGRDGSEATEEA